MKKENKKEKIKINTPIGSEEIEKLRAGDLVSITGTIFTARDKAYDRILEYIGKGE